MQALGNACFDLDPEQRPTFKQCIEQVSNMQASLSAETGAAEGLEARNQTRPAIAGSDIPDVLTCANQAPVQTEAALPVVPNSPAVAA